MRSVVGDSEAPMMGGKKRRSVSYKKGGMGGNMRSVVGDSQAPMMGGKKHRSKKGGMGGNMRSVVGDSQAHMMGGKKHRSVSSKKSKSRRAHSSHRRTAKEVVWVMVLERFSKRQSFLLEFLLGKRKAKNVVKLYSFI